MGTTAQKLTYLNDTKSLLKDSINSLGGEITSQTTFRQYATELDSIYASLPKVSGTGSNIQLTPTKKGRITSQINGDTLQDGTPTPDTPVEIQSVTGLQKINVCGKNLFDIADGTYTNSSSGRTASITFTNGIMTNFEHNFSGNFGIKIQLRTPIILKANQSYTRGTNSNYVYPYITLYDVNSQVIDSMTASNNGVKTFTPTEQKEVHYIFLWFQYNLTYTELKPMMNVGSTLETFEKYDGETYTIHLGNMKLKKKGDYQDYISGTPNNWVKNNKIGNIIFNGTETWSNASSIASGTSRFLYLDDTVYNSRNNNDNTVYVSSNKFIGLSWKEIYSTDTTTKNAVANYNNDASASGRIVIRIDSTYANTVETFKTWLSSNNVEVDYVLATPTTTPITDTTLINDLNNFYYAMSKNGQTNISVDGNLPIILDVSALKGEE